MSFLELGGGFRNELETNDAGEQISEKNRYGLELGIVIPIFDTGEAWVTTAARDLHAAVNRLAERSINARSEASRRLYDLSRDLRHRPLLTRRASCRCGSRTPPRFCCATTACSSSVFELLADSRDQVAAVNGYIDALKDY